MKQNFEKHAAHFGFKLLDMMGETIQKHDVSFFCPPDTPCRGGDAGGDWCKACWLKAVLKRLNEEAAR
jgi:hypothetical protein